MSRTKRTFPNKYVKKESLKREDKARIEFAEKLLEEFKDADYIEELKAGVGKVLSKLNEKVGE